MHIILVKMHTEKIKDKLNKKSKKVYKDHKK